MRKNFLRAVLLTLLTFATAFFTVSCLEIDNSEPLEHIAVVNVPESIRIGKFNEANIKVRIVSGSTRELFPIKEEMIPEPYKSMLSVVGEHEITLLYRGERVTFTVVIRDTIVLDVNFKNALGDTVTSYTVSEDDLSDITPPTDEEMAVEGYRFLGTFDKDYTTLTDSADVYGQYVKTWKVAFYNGEEEIISEQIVDDGQSALEPTEEERSMQGFEWVCWDNSFHIITKDTKVCGFYVAISTQGDDEEELTPTSDEYFTFTLLSDDTYEIKAKDLNNMPSEVVLPESFNGAPVTIIANKAFSGCKSLTSITIPTSVTKIMGYAFYGCKSLTGIIIPSSVASIGECAFYGCVNLSEIIIPANVTEIGESAFQECVNLESVRFEESSRLQSLEHQVFCFCTKLDSIVIPNSVTKIMDGAFYECKSLTDIIIPDSVTSIGWDAFYDCPNLERVTIGSGVISICGRAFDCKKLNTVYYKGSIEKWNNIEIDTIESINNYLIRAKRYYYSEEQPTESGNYWHYDENGEIAVW